MTMLTSMWSSTTRAGASVALAMVLGCSGGSGAGKGAAGPGNDHAGNGDQSNGAGDQANPCGGDTGNPCAAGGDAGTAEPEKPASLVTFELVNTDPDQPLELAVDKGWSLVISGYSGKPPKATPIILFPQHCTAACDAADEERCPVCEAPKDAAAEKEGEQRLVIEPGKSYSQPWDGQVHAYEKGKGMQKGRRTSCQCYRLQPVPPDTYTLRACGLRVTTSAKKTSKFQCVTTEVQLPPAEPTTIRFEFPKPGK